MYNRILFSIIDELPKSLELPSIQTEIKKQEELINKIKSDLFEVKQILTSIIDKNSIKGS